MTLKSLMEEKELVVSVGTMRDEYKGKLQSRLEGISIDDAKFEEIAKEFATNLLKNNGFAKQKKSISMTLTVKEIIQALEVAGTSMIELPVVNEFDIVMIGGTDTVLKIGNGSDAAYHPISKR